MTDGIESLATVFFIVIAVGFLIVGIDGLAWWMFGVDLFGI